MKIDKKIIELFKNRKSMEAILSFFDIVFLGVIVAKNRKVQHINEIALDLVNVEKSYAVGQTLYNINPKLEFAKEKDPNYLHTEVDKIAGNDIALTSYLYKDGQDEYIILLVQEAILYESSITKLSSYIALKQELDAIIETTPDVIYSVDSNGYFLSINSAFTEVFNLSKEDVIGKNIRVLKEEGIYPENVAIMALEQKQEITLTQEIGGNEYLISSYPMFDKQGNISFAVTKIRNMEELVKIKDELDSVKKLSKNYFSELTVLRNRYSKPTDIVAKSKEMDRVLNLAEKVATVDSTVVINGDSGTGKEVIAKYIHSLSQRSQEPFIKVNIGAIPDNLLESELFGYEKGSFTGASKEGKAGLFEISNKGTLLLDEIGDMPMQLQVKILRVLQEGEFYRIGSIKPIKTDVRIIATTHRNLKELVRKGKFREDLYYRLNVVQIVIPPLAERRDDIIPLTYSFLRKYNDKYGFNKTIDADIVTKLVSWKWPGNVRELKNTVERLVVLSNDNTISKNSLPPNILQQILNPSGMTNIDVDKSLSLEEQVGAYEKELILKTYRENNEDIKKTAEVLGVHRTTILRKLNKYK